MRGRSSHVSTPFVSKRYVMILCSRPHVGPKPKRKQGVPDPQVPEPPNKQQHVQQPGCMATNLARDTLPPLAVLFTLYSAVDISRRCTAPSDVSARVQINTLSEERIPPPAFNGGNTVVHNLSEIGRHH